MGPIAALPPKSASAEVAGAKQERCLQLNLLDVVVPELVQP